MNYGKYGTLTIQNNKRSRARHQKMEKNFIWRLPLLMHQPGMAAKSNTNTSGSKEAHQQQQGPSSCMMYNNNMMMMMMMILEKKEKKKKNHDR